MLLLLAGEPRQAFAVASIAGMVGLFILGAWWVRDRFRADEYGDEARRLGLLDSLHRIAGRDVGDRRVRRNLAHD